ncbi:MAG: isoprenyl transferase [Armatimonadetes bacterium]|nr:isoprenyl transferase [Armatimonadota bacterium]
MRQPTGALRAEESVEEMAARLRQGAVPRHIAIIMDGNGRWATRQGLPRIMGHQAGTEGVRQMVQGCRLLGIEILTLYTFSVENWRRPADEVQGLMILIEAVIRREIDALDEAGVRLGVIGRVSELPASLQEELRRDMERTRHNTQLNLNLAVNYGGRAEIIDAARRLARDARDGRLDPDAIDEPTFARALYTHSLPDPDLLIRTAGEQRISNFLLWQIAYAEMWVTDVPWPEFGQAQLMQAVADFQHRQRKFGGLAGVRP